jgi:hypothetical protein
MRHARLPLTLIAAMVLAGPVAKSGTITFSGDIREPTCAMQGTLPACTRPAAVETRPIAPVALAAVPLFAYALSREPAMHWRVIEVVYR